MKSIKNKAVFKIIFLCLSFAIIFYLFPEVIRRLLGSNPVVVGIAEAIILLIYIILGLFNFVCFYLLVDKMKINLVLIIAILYLIKLDYYV